MANYISAASVGARHLQELWTIAYPTKNTYSMRFGCEFSIRPGEKSNEKRNEERQLEGVKLPNYLNMFPTPKAFQDGTTPEKMEELEKENPKYFKARMQHLSTRLRYEEHQKDQEKITKYPTPVASNIQSPQPDRVERNQSGGFILRKKNKPNSTCRRGFKM